MSLIFEPLISSALWLTLVVAAVALLGWYAWNRPWGIGRVRWGAIISLMAAGSALVLAILLNPTWQERIPPPAGKPRLAVVVDASASMAATDMPDGRSRFQSAAEIAISVAAEILSVRDAVHVMVTPLALSPSSTAPDAAGAMSSAPVR